MTTSGVQQILRSLPLLTPTPAEWLTHVLADFDSFLADHALCERKAHAAALMLVNRYGEFSTLRSAMAELASEELDHFHMVSEQLRHRGVPLPPDEVDHYVKDLLKLARHPRPENLLDRLLIVALIEARSCERFCLVAEALKPGVMKEFYTQFAVSEGRHYPLFVEQAKNIYPSEVVDQRLGELLAAESEIMSRLPLRAAVH